MKKTKLLTTILSGSMLAALLPVAITSCNKSKDPETKELKIDDSKVTKSLYQGVYDTSITTLALTYTNFTLGENFNPSEIDVAVDSQEFDGTITPKIVDINGQNFSVEVTFTAKESLYSAYAKFNLAFSSKSNPEQKFTVSGLSAQFSFETLTITEDFEDTQKIYTTKDTLDFVLPGTFTAKWDGLVQLLDISNFYVSCESESESTEVTAEPIQYSETGKFTLKFHFNKFAINQSTTVIFTIKNLQLPGWSHESEVTFNISNKAADRYSFEIVESATLGKSATITNWYDQGDTMDIPTTVQDPATQANIVVTKIAKDCFSHKYNLKNLTIPNYVITPENLGFTDETTPFEFTHLETIKVQSGNPAFTSAPDGHGERNGVYTVPEDNTTTLVVGSKNTTFPDEMATKVRKYAFKSNLAIEGFDFHGKISEIGEGVFENCINLKTSTISGNLPMISKRMYKNCIQFEQLNIDGQCNIGSIGSEAFAGCETIQEISISKSITSIESDAFADCRSLNKVEVDSANTKYKSEGNCIIDIDKNQIVVGTNTSVVPNTVESIAADAFNGRMGLKSLELPTSVTAIKTRAFANCYNLETINTGRALYINDSAFDSCISLKSASVAYAADVDLGTGIFRNCFSLQSVEFNTSWTRIPEYMFYNCYTLNTITIPDNIKTIEQYAFSNCISLETINGLDHIETINNNAFTKCVSLETIDISKATTIGNAAFKYCTSLSNITFCDTLTTLPEDCFADCIGLENIVVPQSVTSFGNRCFRYCTNLKTISDKAYWTNKNTIGDYAFEFCISLEKFNLAETTSVGKYAFANCWNCFADGISLSNMTNIGTYAFSNCISIPRTITFESTIAAEGIGSYAFANCTSITEANFSACTALTNVPTGIFYGCSQLTTVTLPTSIVTIGDYAFDGCSLLKENPITVSHNNLTSIGAYAFNGCVSIEKASFASTVKTIGICAFAGCRSLHYLSLNSVVTINAYAFNGCSRLNDVTIPGTCTYIGTDAFANTGLATAEFEVPAGWYYDVTHGKAVAEELLAKGTAASNFLLEGRAITRTQPAGK